jgi:hypothetical protein
MVAMNAAELLDGSDQSRGTSKRAHWNTRPDDLVFMSGDLDARVHWMCVLEVRRTVILP